MLLTEDNMGKIKDILRSPEYKKVESDIEGFVKEKLQGYIPAVTGKRQSMIRYGGQLIILNGKCRSLIVPFFKD